MSLLLDEVALATLRLAEAGVESPRADAELIAASVHNVRRGELHTVPDSAFDAQFWADIARRAAREPLQHITGRAHFRYLELDVGPGVFVPRPETEVMTGWAIGKLRDMDVAEPVVADLGTGSGAIALAIGQEVPRARVHAVEADPLARAWAERNITSYVQSAPYTAGRIMLHAGDFADALHDLDGTVDLVVSNPPYIPVGAYVEPEVSEYDPPGALWSGTDGLQAIRSVERTARRLLRPGGLLAVEHGFQQGAAVYWVFPEESGWQDTRNHKDLTRRDRFVTATWPGGPLADGRIEGWFGNEDDSSAEELTGGFDRSVDQRAAGYRHGRRLARPATALR
jgi:release factor glutamine methyltransferase